ncbi:tRNA-guanine(15) transglycosylase-like protein [Lactifluus volemus]|nr:tRNA-guanine(15) transglycosylase-like protein [Lactifluus volemus]
MSTLRFHIQHTLPPTFSPRLGTLSLQRHSDNIEIDTPSLITCTSRGLVPHLSGDHTRVSEAIRWLNVPLNPCDLELSPPLPTLHPGPYPLHSCLGFRPKHHILSMTLRDPADDRDMPPNGNDFVSALCLHGVRKVTPDEWREYVHSAQPDVVVALSDIPSTSGSHSQKRITKSIERSASWLANILRPLSGRHVAAAVTKISGNPASQLLNVFVHMAGGTTPAARQAFAQSLLEPLFDKDAAAIEPLNNLDQGVLGYVFNLAPLHKSLSPTPLHHHGAASKNGFVAVIDLFATPPAPSATAQIISLIRVSLEPLPATKPRVVHSAGSPHEILALIRDVGIDLFDAHWAQRAADVGVALDFVFPAPHVAAPPREIGHNLYDKRYSHDFSPFADALQSCSSVQQGDTRPRTPAHTPLPYTRAYVHHLLHTHEMSAHTLLTLHNLAVLDTFFVGVRHVLSEQPETFSHEVTRFEQTYDGKLGVLAEARKIWTEVSLARGKGRLAREREREKQQQ